MEISVGIDIVEIDKFEKIFKRYGERFINKIFTLSEKEYFKNDVLKMAISFSLKESVWKALPEEIQKKFFFKNINIGWKENKPFLMNKIENYKFLISFSISQNYLITLVFMLRS